MADEQKNYFEFLDILDGSGGSNRWYATDAEAQAAIAEIEEEISTLDPAQYASVQTCQDIVSELT